MNKNIIGDVIGKNTIMGMSPRSKQVQKNDEPTKIVTYSADKTGCAHYRIVWPNYVLNSRKNYLIADLKRPILDAGWYNGVDTIRFQRQVSTVQYNYYQNIRKVCDKFGIKLIYELDDIPLYEDIPLFNANRKSYARKDYRDNIINMMEMPLLCTQHRKWIF